MKTVQERFEARFVKGDDCWEWAAHKDRKGYGTFEFAGRTQKAHRVAHQLYVGKIPDGLCVCHHCDNPGCVRPDHLFLGTIADNNRDCENKGRGVGKGRGAHLFGEKNGRAKLSEAQVIEIRARHGDGVRNVVLAKKFGVARPTISQIVHGHRRASV